MGPIRISDFISFHISDYPNGTSIVAQEDSFETQSILCCLVKTRLSLSSAWQGHARTGSSFYIGGPRAAPATAFSGGMGPRAENLRMENKLQKLVNFPDTNDPRCEMVQLSDRMLRQAGMNLHPAAAIIDIGKALSLIKI